MHYKINQTYKLLRLAYNLYKESKPNKIVDVQPTQVNNTSPHTSADGRAWEEDYFVGDNENELGKFYNHTFVSNDEDFGYQQDTYLDGSSNYGEEDEFQFPKSPYQELVEDIGDGKIITDEDKKIKHNFNTIIFSLYRLTDNFEKNIKNIISKFNTEYFDKFKDNKILIQINNFIKKINVLNLNFYKKYNEAIDYHNEKKELKTYDEIINFYTEFLEDLKVFDEVLRFESIVLKIAPLKKLIIKISKLNYKIIQELNDNIYKYKNLEKVLKQEKQLEIDKKEKEKQRRAKLKQKKIEEAMKERAEGPDWRPKETIPEDHYAL